jgi:hypothetical protein
LDDRAELSSELASRRRIEQISNVGQVAFSIAQSDLDETVSNISCFFHPFQPAANPTLAGLIADKGGRANQSLEKDDDKKPGARY